MAARAPLETIAEKLSARTPEVRAIALAHAAAHGAAARSLAPAVARLLADADPEVQGAAVRAFAAIGAGAAEAVPVLIELVRARASGDLLVARALTALGHVGPAAASARDVARGLLGREGAVGSAALGALLRIAADDPGTREPFIAALYASEFGPRAAACEVLSRASDAVVDAVLADITPRLAGGAIVRGMIGAVLGPLAARRPTAVAALARDLLGRDAEPCVWTTLSALSIAKLPPEALVTLVPELAAAAGDGRHAALKLLAEIGPAASAARDVVVAQLRLRAAGPPILGPGGHDASSFAAAATALAAMGASPEHAAELTTWLARVPGLAEDAERRPSWGVVGDVALAASRLAATEDPGLDAALVAIAATSRAGVLVDPDGVAELDQRLREAATGRAALAPLLEAAGVAPSAAAPEEALDLPDFPPEVPLPAVRAEPLPPAVVEALIRSIVAGAALAGVDAGAPAAEIAEAVDVRVRRAHADATALTPTEIEALAVLWGKAVSQAGGWSWALVVRDGATSISVVSTDRAHACCPLAFLTSQADAACPTSARALFDRIRTGDLPRAPVDALLDVAFSAL